MDWQSIIETIGSTAVIVAAFAWLARAVFQSYLSKDIEKFKYTLRNQAFEFESLHIKRANIIAELYAKLFELESSFQFLELELFKRQIRVGMADIFPNKREPWEIKEGIDTLSNGEDSLVKKISEQSSELSNFYGKNKIYFPASLCAIIEKFTHLISGSASSYSSVALTDEKGEHYVNPEVINAWNKSVPLIPEILKNLENEFRKILGVRDVNT